MPGWINFIADSAHRPGSVTYSLIFRALASRLRPAWPAWTLGAAVLTVSAGTVLWAIPAQAQQRPAYQPPTAAQLAQARSELGALAIASTTEMPAIPVSLAGAISHVPTAAEAARDLAILKAQALAAAHMAWLAAHTMYGVPSGIGPFEACVIARESQGNAQVMNASGHYGLFQFAYSTWVKYGGSPSAFGHATVEQQQAVFAKAMATPGGASNWTPYDGCQYSGALLNLTAVPFGTGLTTRALDWALAQQGKPYIWGGTGPGGFDCSGLVYAAYQAQGVAIPRDTFQMLGAAGSVLIPISSPVRGALAFYGSGHVELWWAPGVTFGAQQPGTLIGFHDYSAWWHPTAYYLIR